MRSQTLELGMHLGGPAPEIDGHVTAPPAPIATVPRDATAVWITWRG
ncbi:hypothetical protein [Kibdelosporangium aridum]|nr:hypothetical protein [Kibdelosporangium aridum]